MDADAVDTVLAAVVALTFVFSGGIKVLGVRQSLEVRDHLGVAPGLWRVIGALELLGAVGVLVGLGIDLIGTLALIGLALLMVGAAASRVRVRDHPLMVGLDAAVLALVVATLVVHLA